MNGLQRVFNNNLKLKMEKNIFQKNTLKEKPLKLTITEADIVV